MIEGFAQLHPACRQPMPNHHIEKDKYSYLVIWKNEEQRDIVKADDIVRALRAYCVKKKKRNKPLAENKHHLRKADITSFTLVGGKYTFFFFAVIFTFQK